MPQSGGEFRARFADRQRGAEDAGMDQSADQAARHVAAADEGDARVMRER